jgi:hypothetical protein
MRKIIVSEYVSLDGVMQDPGGVGEFEHGGWTVPYWSDELAAFKHDELLEAMACCWDGSPTRASRQRGRRRPTKATTPSG